MERIPKNILDTIMLSMTAEDVERLRKSSRTLQTAIADVEREQIYWKARVGELLGLEIPEHVKSDRWKALYDDLVKDGPPSGVHTAIANFGNVDLLALYIPKKLEEIKKSPEAENLEEKISFFFYDLFEADDIYLEENFHIFGYLENYLVQHELTKARPDDYFFLTQALTATDSVDIARSFLEGIEVDEEMDERNISSYYRAALRNPNRKIYDFLRNEAKLPISDRRLFEAVIIADNVTIFKELSYQDIDYVLKKAKGKIATHFLSTAEDFELMVLKFLRYSNWKAVQTSLKHEKMTSRFFNHVLFRQLMYIADRDHSWNPTLLDTLVRTMLDSPLADKAMMVTALTYKSYVPQAIIVLQLDKILNIPLEQKRELALKDQGNRSGEFNYFKDLFVNDDDFVLDLLSSAQYIKVREMLRLRSKVDREFVEVLIVYAEMSKELYATKPPDVQRLLKYLNSLL